MASKAHLIAQANGLRRHATELRRANAAGFRQHVIDVIAGLRDTGLTNAEVEELVPAKLLTETPCRLRPLADQVVIQPTAAADVSKGGIIIPENAKEVPMQGTVLAVGPGSERADGLVRHVAVQVGDVVLFHRYAGSEVTLDDVELRILREEDLLGILAPQAE